MTKGEHGKLSKFTSNQRSYVIISSSCACAYNTFDAHDYGFFQETELLPVMGFTLSDTGDEMEWAQHMLGPLRCMHGEASIDVMVVKVLPILYSIQKYHKRTSNINVQIW